jgi:glyoxylase-like metal-dependent hydrolase (beta-lactamase superfamily II)
VHLTVETFACGPMGNNIYLVVDSAAGEFVVIDPSMESAPALNRAQELEKSGLTMQAIWNTHGHFDHIFDNHLWKTTFNAPLLMHESDLFFVERLREQAMWFGFPPPEQVMPDEFLHAGQTLRVGSHEAQVLHTPGHSPGSVSFHFAADRVCVSGDVIFRGGAGRVDLPGASAQELGESLRLLTSLPDETRLLPGHYEETTVEREKRTNPACLHPSAFFQNT